MSSGDDVDVLPAETRARVHIDQQLTRAGWQVQDKKDLNLFAGQGVAVREVVMKPGHGRVDYLLYVDKAVVGVIEAKPMGTPLSGVEWQSAMYAEGLPADVRLAARTRDGRLPFVFEASGVETHFTNGFDPEPRARLIFNFPKPATLARIVRDADAAPERPTWRAKIRDLPPLDTAPLRPAQIKAISGIENSLADQRFDRSLVQMATGAGKTYTAVTESYRLLKHGGFNRILFLVDRNNLADQTLAEFQNYRTPDDGRRFTELYNVTKLSSAGPLASTKVTISTIQRVYKFLNDGEVSDVDDPDLDDFTPDAPVTVAYSEVLPPESFDLVVVDEAHRSIYGVWRGVLEYFDAHIVGLTATPGKQTFGFFRQNLVSEYTYPESVADGVNVDFDIYQIRTRISEEGSRIDAGTIVPKVDRRTREQRLETLDEDLEYTTAQLDRAVTATDQIRTVLETFRDRLFTEIFPRRSTVPKTLIFAKDDNHAEEIVRQVREVFGKGNDFAAKITYSARNAKEQLQALRTSPSLRVAVTVDMIATGTDVKPLECVFFMRDVHSAQYFEQMKGRGARTIASADFQAVTPDAASKTRFVIVDAIGVTEHPFVEPPLNRQTSVSLKKLLGKAATLTLTEDEAATLASRLAKLELALTNEERGELDTVAGQPVRDIVRGLVDAVEPSTGSAEAIERAIQPIAANPELRNRILELRATHDRVIDEVSSDELIEAGGVTDTDRARSIVESWRAYLEEHRDEITAIQLAYEAGEQRIDFAYIQGLAARIARPPHNWTPDVIWNAYAAIDAPRVRTCPRHTLTDLVSLIRFTIGVDDELVPYGERVREKYTAWLAQQEQAGVHFNETERWWLDRMVSVIANSAGIYVEDLDDAPFIERGGIDGAIRDLGERAGELIEQLNAELTA
ncbi:type III restriction enzyme, res subunit [Mycobacterium intracellulare subsp. yongonense 05-1390]|uniref:type I restriction endonuclease subunit R n=1 Tax=Mycobacterium intracellulare TaxID=1767 RepID=UPI00035556AD|nr:DEAD/DEAH box helicase family protein [Mycobacterium intracellulare]AGP65770.1 type III restriction enzyme, res subunit [Mycobacterium intracellulare subsp. yongonense 05-1390]